MKDFNKAFLDTAPLIYFLNKTSDFRPKVTYILSYLTKSNCSLVTSVITCAEYLVHPYRQENVGAVSAFWKFLSDAGINIFDIDSNIADKAAQIRAKYQSIKAFDAMQLACACCTNCDLFLTNDKQLRQFSEIRCITVEEWEYEEQSQ